MKHFQRLALALLLVASAFSTHRLAAEVPMILAHQGRITVDGVNPSGPVEFKFALTNGGVDQSRPATATAEVALTKIVSIEVTDQGAGYTSVPAVTIKDSAGMGFGAAATAVLEGTKVVAVIVEQGGADYMGDITVEIAPPGPFIVHQNFWRNDGDTAAGPPATAVTLELTQGLYHVELGNPAIMAAIPIAVFQQPAVFLRTWMRPLGETQFLELLPSQRITAVGYAVMAATVPDGAIATAQLAGDAVTAEKIAPGAIGGVHLAAGSIGGAQIAAGAITGGNLAAGAVQTIHVADASITREKLAPDALDGSGGGSIPIGSGLPSGSSMQIPAGSDPGELIAAGFEYRRTVRGEDEWFTPTQGTPAQAFGEDPLVWTGRHIVIWGGLSGATLQTYDPVRNFWERPNIQGPAPLPRSRHTATWCDGEVIYWGGYTDADNQQVTRTGGSYNPWTRAWTPVPEGNHVPDARALHTAVWTGEHLIIWGGRDFKGDPMNSGAKFNPATGEWTPISTVGAPSHRFAHTAVWTGSRMLIWGGQTISNIKLRSGASYDPATDTWTPINENGAPGARTGHAAVWTGAGMLIWGGETTDAVVRSGAVYNLVTNHWIQVNGGVDAPAARADFASVWTGSELLIFGGRGAEGVFLGDGAALDLESNTWRDLPTLFRPDARRKPGSVWTGREFVIFGGTTLGSQGQEQQSILGAGYTPGSTRWLTIGLTRPSNILGLHAAGDDVFAFASLNSCRYHIESGRWLRSSLAGHPEYDSNARIYSNERYVVIWNGPAGASHVYDIEADTWSPMSVQGMGPATANCGWDGEKLYLFFTESVGGVLQRRVKVYLPETDSWFLVPTLGAEPPIGLAFSRDMHYADGAFYIFPSGGPKNAFGYGIFAFDTAKRRWFFFGGDIVSPILTLDNNANYVPKWEGSHWLSVRGTAAAGGYIINLNRTGKHFYNAPEGRFWERDNGLIYRIVRDASGDPTFSVVSVFAVDNPIAGIVSFDPMLPPHLDTVNEILREGVIDGTSAVAVGADEVIVLGGNAVSGGYWINTRERWVRLLHVPFSTTHPALLWHRDRLFIQGFTVFKPGQEFDVYVKP